MAATISEPSSFSAISSSLQLQRRSLPCTSLRSKSPARLSNSVLLGGGLLFLSNISLKVWRQGKSSAPFFLGQAALSVALIWKNFQAYSLTKKVFPTGFNAIISSAMLCFYLYVLASGGNPPPKKFKSSASISS